MKIWLMLIYVNDSLLNVNDGFLNCLYLKIVRENYRFLFWK